MARQTDSDAGQFGEVGVSGLKVQSGMVQEEFLRELQGERGRRTLEQMATNDSTISAFLHGIETLVRSVEWRTEPAGDDSRSQELAEFADSLRGDMSQTWDDTLSEALTMLIHGWSFQEIVLKRRQGPDQTDPTKRSQFNDGLIGIRKLAARNQRSLWKWEFDEDGGIQGMWQWPPNGGDVVFIPIQRALLYRTKSNGNNPEGASVLRRSYKSWYFLTNIQMSEAIGIERELAGMPVARVPNEVLTDSNRTQERKTYERMVRDLRYNEQAGLVLPSDPYRDGEGNPTQMPLVQFELMSSGGQRSIDTTAVIKRYQQDIARSVLADFLMLGTERGSFALSQSKTDLFLQSLQAYLSQIRDVLNRHLLPRIWAVNGFDPDTMPRFEFGEVAKTDLEELGTFLRNVAGAGIPLGPDENLESELRSRASLPESDEPDGGIGGN